MIIQQRKANDILSSEITPKSIYLNRRKFMTGVLTSAAALATSPALAIQLVDGKPVITNPTELQTKILRAAETAWGKDETLSPHSAVTQYNNFYEFGTGKTDPSRYAGDFKTDNWKVEIGGECEVKGQFTLEDILKPMDLEERIYRLRCVEAWSMVIPWIGFPLAGLLKRFKPLSSAKYVEFTTLEDPKQMPGQRSVFSTIDWPYKEGLRMDEAMHPLTLMAVGLYGDILPNQNGAPLRLVVPWKYGFKSIKSIVAIRFVEEMPRTTWNDLAPQEYGFYANVNPKVDHPRWSQASERRLPNGLFSANRIPTQLFNGYATEVEGLYRGMDLRRFY
jgi:sulfoxide reductase catalytic subunit YedY